LDRQYRHTIAECAQIARASQVEGDESMKTADIWGVIQGDEGCRDGHYRAKQDLRPKTMTSVGTHLAVELDPNDSTSLQAQNPTDLGKLRVELLLKRQPVFLPFGIPCSTELGKWVRFDRPKLF
jgi:hypothetical protein